MKLLKRVSILAVLITVIAVFAGCGKEATVVGKERNDIKSAGLCTISY